MVAAGGMAGDGGGSGILAAEKDRLEHGEIRVFRVSVDVRSFRAGSRLPARAINAFVRVVLPQAIVKLAMTSPYPANVAKLTAPLRSHPPVLVAKGTEHVIPNGYVALELPASVAGLSAALAEEPHILAQVMHSDRYMADSIVGVASIPMASLMHDSRLDGYAPVFSQSEGGQPGADDQVNIGYLRVVLAVEEVGPVMGPPTRHRKSVEHAYFETGKESQGARLNRLIDTPENPAASLGGGNKHQRKMVNDMPRSDDYAKEHPQENSESRPPFHSAESPPKATADRDCGAPKTEKDIRQTLEYEMAWEFEMWRRSEEAKWRADLKDREMARMSVLEDEWRKREREHTADLERARKEQDVLESKLKAQLFEVEKMERKLVQGQEAAILRKEAMERENSQRMADAQVAVKRHQTECEHRVELEKIKYTALLEQHAMLEKRLATSNKTLAAIERQFADFKAAQRGTYEADLSAQVLVLKQQCSDFKASLEAAVRSKDEYKSQVLRMAKEMATLYREHQGYSKSDSNKESRGELQQLKEQVRRLQLQEERAPAQGMAAAATAAAPLQLLTPEKSGLEAVAPAQAHASAATEPPKAAGPGTLKRPLEDGPDSEEDVYIIPASNSRVAAMPMFAKPAADNVSLETPLEHASDQPGGGSLRNRGPSEGGELRKPLSDMGQKCVDWPVVEAQLQKGSTRRFSDVEIELNEKDDSEALHIEKEIRRLKRQRSELLDTGIYGVADRIIRGLDQEIRKLLGG